jgi:hypothetical protein
LYASFLLAHGYLGIEHGTINHAAICVTPRTIDFYSYGPLIRL